MSTFHEKLQQISIHLDKLTDLQEALTQNKYFTIALVEHVCSIYQHLHLLSKEEILPQGSPSVEALIKSTTEGAEFLVNILSKDPKYQRKGDKQNEYVFERESSELIEQIKKHINGMRAIASEIKLFGYGTNTNRSFLEEKNEDSSGKKSTLLSSEIPTFPIIARYSASANGIPTPEELCGNPLTFNTLGNEVFCGRSDVLDKTLYRIVKSDEKAKAKVVLIRGINGIGKTNFAIQVCKQLCLHLEPIAKKEEVQMRTFYIRCKGNTEFPQTTNEIMTFILKQWHIGSRLPTKDQELRELYYRTFYNKIVIMLLDDVTNVKQVLEILPRIDSSYGFMKTVIVLTTNSESLNTLSNFTKGQIDEVDSIKGIKEVRQKQVSEGGKEEEDDDDDDEDEDDGGEEGDNVDEEIQPVSDDANDKEIEQFRQNVGTKVFSIALQTNNSSSENQNNSNDIPKHTRKFHLISVHLDKLGLAEGVQIAKSLNTDMTEDNANGLTVLCENKPIFLKIATKTQKLYCGQSMDEFIKYISSQMDRQAQTDHNSDLRVICYGFFIGCFKLWPPKFQDVILQLTVFPNEFDIYAASLVLEMNMCELLECLINLMNTGVIRPGSAPQRYCLHDLVRETFICYLQEEEKKKMDSLDLCRERMMQYYFDLLQAMNNQHKHAGLSSIVGLESCDIESENIKVLTEYMQENPTDHIELVNYSRYLLIDRIPPIARGILYRKLSFSIDSIEKYSQKGDFYEGFAMVYFELTDFNRANFEAKQALDMKEKALTMDDPPATELEFLPILQILAEIMLENKEIENAKQYYQRMISIANNSAQSWQKVTVTEKETKENSLLEQGSTMIIDPFMAYAQIQLGIIHLKSGDFKTGRNYFNQGISVMSRILGKVHPEISNSFNNYANILKQYKNVRQYYDEINAIFSEALSIDKSIYGEKSIIVSDRMDSWGVSLLGQAKFSEAEQMFRQAIDIKHRVLGRDLRDINMSALLNNLAVSLKNQGKYDEAEKLYEQALEMMIDILGPDHQQVSVAKTNLAHVYNSTGKSQKAEELYKEAFSTVKDTQQSTSNVDQNDIGNGQSNELMAAMYVNMGDTSRQKNDFDKAIDYYRQALDIRKKVSRDTSQDPEVAKILNSIAKLYYEKGEYQLADEFHSEAVNIIISTVGKEHPHYATVLLSLANVKFKQNKLSDAEKMYAEVLKLKKEVLKEEGFMLVLAMQPLAIVYEKQKRFRDAEVLFREILAMLEKQEKVDDKIRQVLSSIATNLSRQKLFSEAEKFYLKSQTYILNEFGADSMENANILANIAATQIHQQNFIDAEQSYQKALGIYKDILGEDHEKVESIEENLRDIRRVIKEQKGNSCCVIC